MNLYFDVSGTKSSAALHCALEVVDASHILFGSDFPANQNIPHSIETIRNAELSDESKMQIMENQILYLILIVGTIILNWDIINNTNEGSISEEE